MEQLIGEGSSRYVYDTNDGFVIKKPKTRMGVWQNQSEIRLYKKNGDNGILLPIEKYDEKGKWVIQKKCTPINDNNVHLFKDIYGIEFYELCRLIDFIRYQLYINDKKGKPIYIPYSIKNDFLLKFAKYLIDNKISFIVDLKEKHNWGYLDGKIYLIDYGMDNETYKKYGGKTIGNVICLD